MAGEGLTKSQSLYFHIQTSAIKRKYITLIVCISCFSLLTFNIEMYLYSNILRSQAKCSEVFVRHGTYHVLVREGSHFCQSPKGGGGGSGVFFFIKTQRNTCFGKSPPNRGLSSDKLLLLKDNPVIDFLPFSTLQPLE